jgi:phage terminase large subunit
MQAQDLLSDLHPIDLRKELFRRQDFSFITVRDGKRHLKQEQALFTLTNRVTEEFLYGGAAGGAKSWTGCAWLLFMCLIYPGTRWFIGREELKRITESTLITFFKVAAAYGCSSFRYNGQKNFIIFENGSRIDLLELKHLPRDPMFERLGSTEYTGGWIEEAGEVDFGAYDTLKTRIGRHLNDKYNILAKIFITCNPKKNWLYTHFYKPAMKRKLPRIMKFMQAFIQDNPFRENGYLERLERTSDKAKRERLFHGNWEYDDDPNALCSFDDIDAVFENDHLIAKIQSEEHYLTCDVARLGSDKARIAVWKGWSIIAKKSYDLSLTTDIQKQINTYRREYQIPKKNCVADQDGVGGGVVDNCGIEGFVNNARPIKVKMKTNKDTRGHREEPNYVNYQVQCGYYLVEKINTHQFWIKASCTEDERQEIREELGELKSAKTDDDKKVYLKSKKDIKKDIGRSPDWRDLFLMRAHFDLKPKRGIATYGSLK